MAAQRDEARHLLTFAKVETLFSYAYPGFSLGVHFSSPKSWRLFSRRNEAYIARSKRQHSVVKISQLIGAPPGGRRPLPYGTTGTMVNPALSVTLFFLFKN